MLQYFTPNYPKWHYNSNHNVWQKVNNQVFVYVQRMIGFSMVQCYIRGHKNMTLCILEVRSSKHSYDQLFAIGETWLDKYGDDLSKIHLDYHHTANPEGAWGILGKERKDYFMD